MKLHNLLALPLITLVLSACSSVKVWPFDGDKSAGAANRSNATEYNCEGGKRFFVRTVDNGASAWLILPDHEVRLDKSAEANRYSNGIAVLDINGDEASLKDGDKLAYSGCKAVKTVK